jgi:hypothetical protein
MRLDLARDPAVIAIASAKARRVSGGILAGSWRVSVGGPTLIGVPSAIGALHAIWSWFSEQSIEGSAHVSTEYLDSLVSMRGFCDAMMAVGWLERVDSGTLRLPGWDRWLSKGGKARLVEARKKARQRRAAALESVPVVSRSCPDDVGTRGEERRVETTTPLPPRRGEQRLVPTDEPEQPDDNGHQTAKSFEPQHPMTRSLCESIDVGRRYVDPECKPLALSVPSLRAMDGLLLRDGREPKAVLELLEWLFGGQEFDYTPDRPERFDWRRAIKTAAALRRNWDDLSGQRRAALETRR